MARAVAVLSIFLLVQMSQAFGQAWPAKPIRFLAPTSAGSPIDLVARLLGERLAQNLGQPVVVDNRAGATGTIGMAEFVRQPADGYTIAIIFMPLTVTPALIPGLGYDLVRDVQPVTQLVWQYNVLVVNPAVRANSVAELVALLKAEPGRHSFASAGNGTPAHLAGELFKQQGRLDAVHVPYKVFRQTLTDLMGGQTSFMFAAAGPTLPLLKGGKLRPLAVLSPQRLATLPDVPTMVEAGFADMVVRDWQGIVVRAGTPREIVERFNAEFRRIVGEPEIAARIRSIGADPATGAPEEFGALMRAETERWGKLVREAGIKAD